MKKISNRKARAESSSLAEAAREQIDRHPALRTIRTVIVLVTGGSVLLIGCALVVLPGPAIMVIPAGLGILGLEFRWARRWLRRARELVDKATGD